MTLAARKIRLLMELRRNGITDTAVLRAIEQVPREAFVPAPFMDQAYENLALPIERGQTLSQPQVVARMTQALGAAGVGKVLEVGTGSGYQTAVLSRLCRRVYSVERYRELIGDAERRFRALRLHNVVPKVGDGWNGWPEQAPFPRIIVTAAPPDVPGTLVDQLAEGGVLVIPVGRRSRQQELLRLTKKNAKVVEETLGPVRFVPLVSGVPEEAPKPAARVQYSGPRDWSLA